MLKLEFPEEKHKKAYEELILEWGKIEDISDMSPSALFRGNNFEEFTKFTNNEVSNSSWVNSHLFFLVEDNRILGGIHIRHHINNPVLIETGGHIGYGIAPWERKKGYAGEMLKLGLVEAKKLGLDKVLVTCDDDNIGSMKTIEKNGGVFEYDVENEGKKVRRYWIEL